MSIVQESAQQNDTVTSRLSASWVFLYWVFALLCLLPWIIVQSQTAVNSDVAWLSVCAERILAGGSMSQDCYDNNPPLSIVIYMLPVGLSQLLDIPSYHLIFWITFALALAASYACYRFLVILEWADQHEALLYAFAFLASVTIIPALSYAEREQFIAFGMLPFALCQISITKGKPLPKILMFSTLIFGAIALLIKPFFGLLSVFLLLHRAYLRKSWTGIFRIVLDPDFTTLSIITVIYLTIVTLFFWDFVLNILPNSYDLYFGYNNLAALMPKAKIFLLFIIVNFIVFFFTVGRTNVEFMILLSGGAILCVFVYIIQMKGFGYHILPVYPFLSMAILLNCVSVTWGLTDDKRARRYMSRLLIILVFMCVYAYTPPNEKYPQHQDYQDNVVTHYLEKYCAKPCVYFISNENMGIVSEVAFYNKSIYASRFPTYWFSPMIEQRIEHFANEAEKSKAIELKKYFSEMVASDFERYNPSVLLVQYDKDTKEEYPMSSFLNSERYANFIQKYQKVDRMSFDRANFYPKTKYDFRYIQTFDIYVKKTTLISSP